MTCVLVSAAFISELIKLKISYTFQSPLFYDRCTLFYDYEWGSKSNGQRFKDSFFEATEKTIVY